VGSWSARDAREIHGRLAKPPWAPPGAVFGPVWTVLYAAIRAAGWRIAGRRGDPALPLHLTQLVLNGAWSPLFFSARRRRAALGVVVALDLTVAAEVAVLGRRDRVAASLLAPYLAWSLYATALTAAVSDPAEVAQGSGNRSRSGPAGDRRG
jgi:translocator protein